MKKRQYIIQDAVSKKYWYGHYTNQKWTDSIDEAKCFESKVECTDYISLYNEEDFKGLYIMPIEIWVG